MAVTRPEHEAHHSPPTGAEVKNECSSTPLPPSPHTASLRLCIGKSLSYIFTDELFVGMGSNIIHIEFVNKTGTASHLSSDVNLFHLQLKISCSTGLHSFPSTFQVDAEDLITDHGNSLQHSSKFTLYMHSQTQQLMQRNKYRRLRLLVPRRHDKIGLPIKFRYAIFVSSI